MCARYVCLTQDYTTLTYITWDGNGDMVTEAALDVDLHIT